MALVITPRFAPGDEVWVFDKQDGASKLTVGQVRVEVTASPGLRGLSRFSNFSAQASYVEQYMCVETGVGSGTIYTLDKSVFATKEECLAANAERIEQHKRHKEELRQLDIKRAQAAILAAENDLKRLQGVA